MKDILLSNLDLSNFRTVDSDRLFYDQYLYCALFRQVELSAIRGLRPQHIDQVIAMRNRWRQMSNNSRGTITTDVIERLHRICRFLQARQDRLKIVISMDYGYVYTNDLEILQDIRDMAWISIYDLKQVRITRPRDVVVKQNPTHTSRSYLRDMRVSKEQRVRMQTYLQQRETIKIGPGLKSWLGKSGTNYASHLVQSYFFFDHNDDGELFLFQLAFPGLIRKTVPIVAK